MAHSQAAALDAPTSRWPGVLGVLGIVLGALTVLDKASDLMWLIVWSEADWSRVLPADLARLAVNVMPPEPWIALTSLIWIALSALLIAGSVELYRRQRSGVRHSRLWARLAICWIAVEWAVGLWWLTTIVDHISEVAPAGWQAGAVPATLFILALILAYPVFVLVWLGRPAICHEHAGWEP